MKRINELKWQIGLAGALGIVILFSGVKASPAFDQAVLTASSNTNLTTSWDNSQVPDSNSQFPPYSGSSTGPGLNSERGHHNFNGSINQGTNSAPQTRTRRS